MEASVVLVVVVVVVVVVKVTVVSSKLSMGVVEAVLSSEVLFLARSRRLAKVTPGKSRGWSGKTLSVVTSGLWVEVRGCSRST
jgi:hypothetical protein